MPIIELPLIWIIALDAFAWAIFHMAISFFTVQIPYTWFERHNRLFQSFNFEKRGKLWNQLFFVKSWKSFIPDGTMFIRGGYNKQALHGNTISALKEFVIESRRAEYTHWLSILPAFLFFLWNPLWASWLNVTYAVCFNVPIIVAQRYNRPRLERIIARKKHKLSA